MRTLVLYLTQNEAQSLEKNFNTHSVPTTQISNDRDGGLARVLQKAARLAVKLILKTHNKLEIAVLWEAMQEMQKELIMNNVTTVEQFLTIYTNIFLTRDDYWVSLKQPAPLDDDMRTYTIRESTAEYLKDLKTHTDSHTWVAHTSLKKQNQPEHRRPKAPTMHLEENKKTSNSTTKKLHKAKQTTKQTTNHDSNDELEKLEKNRSIIHDKEKLSLKATIVLESMFNDLSDYNQYILLNQFRDDISNNYLEIGNLTTEKQHKLWNLVAELKEAQLAKEASAKLQADDVHRDQNPPPKSPGFPVLIQGATPPKSPDFPVVIPGATPEQALSEDDEDLNQWW